jgi:SAM-dependent methyltransferase
MTRAFDIAYEGTPTWDIGHPQGVVVRLQAAGLIQGDVLDVGCGTGEHALFRAGQGHRVVGIDSARRAVERARAKAAAAPGSAAAPRPSVRFLVHDALDLESLGDAFDTALDVGLFHVLQPEDRRRYARSLASVVRPDGRALVVAWSSRNPFGYGPERISRRMLRSSFLAADGWRVVGIEPEVLESRLPSGRVHAWCAELRRRA